MSKETGGPKWAVGDYAMSRGMTVRINNIEGGGATVEFVSDYRKGVGITCGGYCSSGMSGHELTVVTDPEMLLRCRAYEAKRQIDAAKRTIMEQEKVFEAQTAGLRALQDAMLAHRNREAGDE